METKKVKCNCPSCKGTGLYVDWSCHDGTALVCRECKGTGAVTRPCDEVKKADLFTTRKEPQVDIKRVFDSRPYMMHVFPGKYTYKDGTTIDFSLYGCTLKEWQDGIEPIPIPYTR